MAAPVTGSTTVNTGASISPPRITARAIVAFGMKDLEAVLGAMGIEEPPLPTSFNGIDFEVFLNTPDPARAGRVQGESYKLSLTWISGRLRWVLSRKEAGKTEGLFL